MSTILGFDPSPHRLGWAALDEDTLTLIGYGVIDLTQGAGWLDTRVAYALMRIAERHRNVTHWFREQPMSARAGYGAGMSAGYVCAIVDRAAMKRWRFAARIEQANGTGPAGIRPQEWRVLNDLPGNAKKAECAARAAELADDPMLAVKQDAADAYLIARAGYLLMHPEEVAA